MRHRVLSPSLRWDILKVYLYRNNYAKLGFITVQETLRKTSNYTYISQLESERERVILYIV